MGSEEMCRSIGAIKVNNTQVINSITLFLPLTLACENLCLSEFVNSVLLCTWVMNSFLNRFQSSFLPSKSSISIFGILMRLLDDSSFLAAPFLSQMRKKKRRGKTRSNSLSERVLSSSANSSQTAILAFRDVIFRNPQLARPERGRPREKAFFTVFLGTRNDHSRRNHDMAHLFMLASGYHAGCGGVVFVNECRSVNIENLNHDVAWYEERIEIVADRNHFGTCNEHIETYQSSNVIRSNQPLLVRL